MSTNNLNTAMFFAMKIADRANLPLLLMSNPGLGKSTTVSYFAKIQGYHLELVRGNSKLAEEISGYDCAAPEEKRAIHLRPVWFENILRASSEGKRTILFLDEITTAPTTVQSTLLNIVFDRIIGDEYLPKDTLVFAAGNYIENLTNRMELLPPLMNRFMIFNLRPSVEDVDLFMCKYSGSTTDSRIPFETRLEKMLVELDQQEEIYTPKEKNIIGEYFEKAFANVSKNLMTRENKIDLSVRDMQNIYSDAVGDDDLRNFYSLRSSTYLTEAALQTYVCFGKHGIQSDNFKSIVAGLVGIGLTKEMKNGTYRTIYNDIAQYFYSKAVAIANELHKKNNSTIAPYEDFVKNFNAQFSKTDGSVITESNTFSIVNQKLKALMKDRSVNTIEKPISSEVLEQLATTLQLRVNNLQLEHGMSDLDSKSFDSINSDPDFAGTVMKVIVIWNEAYEAIMTLKTFVQVKDFNYLESTKKTVLRACDTSLTLSFDLKAISRVVLRGNKELEGVFPDIKPTN